MARFLVLCAVTAGLGLGGAALAQQAEPAPQPAPLPAPVPSPAPTQQQVEQPAPDLENLDEDDLNRTLAVQRQQDAQAPADVTEARTQATQVISQWTDRITDNPQVVDAAPEVEDAWVKARQAHSALLQSDDETWRESQQAFQDSVADLDRTWSEATD